VCVEFYADAGVEMRRAFANQIGVDVRATLLHNWPECLPYNSPYGSQNIRDT
jgi:hypothetical protein